VAWHASSASTRARPASAASSSSTSRAMLGAGYREFTQHFPRPAGSSTTPTRSGRPRWPRARRRWRTPAPRPTASPASGSPTSARPRAVGPRHRPPDPPRHRVAGPPHRPTACDRLKSGRPRRTIRRTTGLVVDAYFSGTKVAWLLDEVDGARARRGGRARVRHDGHLAGVAADRRPRARTPSRPTPAARCSTTSAGPLVRRHARPAGRPASVLPEVRLVRRVRDAPIPTPSSASTPRSPASPATSRRPCSARAAGSPACRRTPTAPGRSCCSTPAPTPPTPSTAC
jgi:hypothetical protein